MCSAISLPLFPTAFKSWHFYQKEGIRADFTPPTGALPVKGIDLSAVECWVSVKPRSISSVLPILCHGFAKDLQKDRQRFNGEIHWNYLRIWLSRSLASRLDHLYRL